jgi:hypothetical protein
MNGESTIQSNAKTENRKAPLLIMKQETKLKSLSSEVDLSLMYKIKRSYDL